MIYNILNKQTAEIDRLCISNEKYVKSFTKKPNYFTSKWVDLKCLKDFDEHLESCESKEICELFGLNKDGVYELFKNPEQLKRLVKRIDEFANKKYDAEKLKDFLSKTSILFEKIKHIDV